MHRRLGTVVIRNCLECCDVRRMTVACAEEIREVCRRHMQGRKLAALATVARTCCDVSMTSSDTAWVSVCTMSVGDRVVIPVHSVKKLGWISERLTSGAVVCASK